MTDTCQSVKRSCQFSRFVQLATRFSNFYRVSFDMTISIIRKIPDRSLDANTRNTSRND